MTTYTLAELALLFNNEQWLRQELGPYHELRPGGIFVAPEWQSESYRDEHLPGVRLNLPKTSILDAVLPAEFTEGQLMAFLAIRTDLASELERHYTNGGPYGAAEASALLLNKERLASLEGSLPAFAEMLRRRLPRGTHWYKDTEEDLTGNVASEPASEHERAPGTSSTTHRIDGRTNPLAAVIRLAEAAAADPADWYSVWSELAMLASSANPPEPLRGFKPGDGIWYQLGGQESPVLWLKQDAFKRRQYRKRAKARAPKDS